MKSDFVSHFANTKLAGIFCFLQSSAGKFETFHCSLRYFLRLVNTVDGREQAQVLVEELKETEETNEERWKKKWWPAITRKCQLTFTKFFVENEKWCCVKLRGRGIFFRIDLHRVLLISDKSPFCNDKLILC